MYERDSRKAGCLPLLGKEHVEAREFLFFEAGRQVRQFGRGFQRLGSKLAFDGAAGGWMVVYPDPSDPWAPYVRISRRWRADARSKSRRNSP